MRATLRTGTALTSPCLVSPSPSPAPRSWRWARLSLVAAVVLTVSGVAARAQQYTSIVVFGDSLSDTGNVAHRTEAKYGVRIPGPLADYTDGRFTDGADTVPQAVNYHGVWVEQMAAMLPNRPVVRNSLDGGTDYAFGYAKTARGQTDLTFGQGNVFSVKVDNLGKQITDYLATSPRINRKTLFVVWGGANDVLEAQSPDEVIQAALQEVLDVERLERAGATEILVPNLPPLGATPGLNGSAATSVPATAASVLFNTTLALGLSTLQTKTVHLVQLDVFRLFSDVLFSPQSFLFSNVSASAQGNYTVNPDLYLFWDDLHPTTAGHQILAIAARRSLARGQCTQDTVVGCGS